MPEIKGKAVTIDQTSKLKQFADSAGCKIVLCGPGWGGRYAYIIDEATNAQFCGFKTKTEARLGWLKDTFEGSAGLAVQKLLLG